MRIATLQFSPKVGEMAANFSRAESLLMREEREGMLHNLDLLVLPELAFTGYNHPSLAAIAPFLEPTAAGPSTRWASRTAKRLKCTVAVGYPEATAGEDGEGGGNFNTVYDRKIEAVAGAKAYNSLVFVNSAGDVVAHYRKTFLYYTDETWAEEGGGFYAGVLPIGSGGTQVKVAAGICMDINPYKFEAPWTKYEFANHAREARARVVVVSMAWLTRLSHEEVLGENGMRPDMDTVGYWVERMRPLLGPTASSGEVLLVFANRAGEEGVDPKIGEVRYAGSSCVMSMTRGGEGMDGEVRIWDVFGRAQDGVLIVDTEKEPLYTVQRRAPGWETLADVPRESHGHGTILGGLGDPLNGQEPVALT